jgi:hypothetical protein
VKEQRNAAHLLADYRPLNLTNLTPKKNKSNVKETRKTDKSDTLKNNDETAMKLRCWLLTLVYQPRFCSRCGSSIGRRVPLLEYAIILAVAAAVVWAIV